MWMELVQLALVHNVLAEEFTKITLSELTTVYQITGVGITLYLLRPTLGWIWEFRNTNFARIIGLVLAIEAFIVVIL